LLSNGFSISYLNNLEPAMMECIDVFQQFLEKKCEEANGYAEVDMFSNLANATAVSQCQVTLLNPALSHSMSELSLQMYDDLMMA
tara:strand:+ start:11 stop:265 length:255 start_codon:yes stop_codon:yes gene_type:complete